MKNYIKIMSFCLFSTMIGNYGVNASEQNKDGSSIKKTIDSAKESVCKKYKEMDCFDIIQKHKKTTEIVDTGPYGDVQAFEKYSRCLALYKQCQELPKEKK